MANKKLSQLTTAGSLNDTDIIPIVDGVGTKKVTASTVKTYATSGLSTVSTTGSYDDLTDKPNSILEFGITDGTNGQVLTTNGAGVLSFTTVSGLGGLVNTGDVTFDGIKIIGYGTASGDGLGFATLELVPDNSLYNNHQYLVIDPTTPGHIHIRAGGPQNQSNAQLFLGGENTHVQVVDGDSVVRMENSQESQIFSASISAGLDYSTAEWISDPSGNRIVFNDVQQTTLNAIWGLGGSRSGIEVWDGVNYYTITGTSGSNTPGLGQPATVWVNQAPPSSPVTVAGANFESFDVVSTYVEVDGTDVRIDAQDDIRMYSRDVFLLANYSSTDPIRIATDYNGSTKDWYFRSNGVLELPSGGDIVRNGSSIIPNLASVATSGNYGDLNDKPSLIYRQVAVPTTSKGVSGDQTGDIAFSSGYIYYCTQNYVPNSSSVITLASAPTTVWIGSAGYTGDLVADFTANSTGWTYNGVTILSVSVDNTFGSGYALTGSAGFSVANGEAYALISPDTPSIWKRVAWSSDTW